ncbi:tripartite tricarboxylate transporter substrate binding protein, partial [bacterium]|nr:tripartite tricarboxylate transporter substrate binding protein [bacterium]
MQMLRTRFFILLLVPIACIFLFGQVAEAADWPTRPVEWTISAGAGGGADKYARFLIGLNVKGKYISEPIIPVNKPGGAGAVAMQSVLGQ